MTAQSIGLTCSQCEKRYYPTRAEAKRAARVAGPAMGDRLRAYESCGGWHLTSMDAALISAFRDFSAREQKVMGSDSRPRRCGGCLSAGYPDQASAEKAAAEVVMRHRKHAGGAYAWSCGASWHVRKFRFSGPCGEKAMTRHKDRLVIEALERQERSLRRRPEQVAA